MSYVRHNTTYLYCRSPPGQILNYNWTGPAKKSRLSIADHTLVAFWKHGSTVLQMPSSWAVQTLLATMSQLPGGHLRRCGGCTALLVQLGYSTSSHLRFTLRTAQRFQGYLSRLRARKLASPSPLSEDLATASGFQFFLP
jgi:hypothetical protein